MFTYIKSLTVLDRIVFTLNNNNKPLAYILFNLWRYAIAEFTRIDIKNNFSRIVKNSSLQNTHSFTYIKLVLYTAYIKTQT